MGNCGNCKYWQLIKLDKEANCKKGICARRSPSVTVGMVGMMLSPSDKLYVEPNHAAWIETFSDSGCGEFRSKVCNHAYTTIDAESCALCGKNKLAK